ncbi:MAG: DUF5011 domain-containing protein [Candidatus Peribacteria bacterium]|nr:DUF5011 domain-containing protein [Candidatus Peribacteria bacterium]
MNTSVLGDYFIIYSHTDTAGNTDTATRTIKVIAPPEPLPPILPLPSFNQGR